MAGFLYFAYGSNMLTERLVARCGSARPLGLACATGYTLVFGKRGKDASGKAMLLWSGRAEEIVPGVLFEIDVSECEALDRAEGAGHGYRREQRFAVTRREAGERVAAATYLAEEGYIDLRLVPYEWYRALVVAGARQHGMPADWIAYLSSFPVRDDPEPGREERLHALGRLKDAGFDDLLPSTCPWTGGPGAGRLRARATRASTGASTGASPSLGVCIAQPARCTHRPAGRVEAEVPVSGETNGDQGADWWTGGVIYQIYPRSFADSNGDGVGDLPGITARLGHVAGLGVDGIWLSPFFVSPMKDFGYDVADYCDVDPLFGTLADFDALLAEAHRLGLKVIIDQVYSHSSDRHPWFVESRQDRDNPKADWYVWADPKPDGTPPNNWLAVFGGPAWTWDTRRRQYYFHNFLPEQPDLDFHCRAVQEEVLDIARFWLDRGVDGFRLDVANLYFHDRRLTDNPPRPGPVQDRPYRMQRPLYNRSRPETLAFAGRLRALLDARPGRMAVAELASSDDPPTTMVQYTDGPDRYHTAYNFLLLAEPFGAGVVRTALSTTIGPPPRGWPSWAFSNHDVARAPSRWAAAAGTADGDREFAKLLIALLCCLRGTIFLYQGEELGLPQADVPFERMVDPEGIAFWPRHRGRDGARTPMPWAGDAPNAGFTATGVEPWLPVDPRHLPLAVDRQEADPDSVLGFTRAFLAWRKGRPALVRGDLRFLDLPEPVLGFERTAGADRLLCLFHLGAEPCAIPLARVEAVPAAAPGAAGTLGSDHVRLPARSFLILELGA